MIGSVGRACAAALLGAFAGPAWLVLAYALSPDLVFDFDRDIPAPASGFYAAERDPQRLTFAWTREHAAIDFVDLDRRVPWTLAIRLRGARPDPAAAPDLVIGVDGVTALSHRATQGFQDVEVNLASATGGRRGARITLDVSSPYAPGGGDPRQLGVMIDRIALTPAEDRTPLPPRRAVRAASLSTAVLGAAVGLLGVTPGSAIGAALLLGAGQGAALAHGVGPFGPFVDRVPWLAFWVMAPIVACVVGLERWRGEPLRNTARFAAAFSASALYLKLLVLLHPDMPVGDALFHAHRFEWVQSGRYFFTSAAPGGYTFPYPIALYVFALPFASLTHDHVALLRIAAASVDAACIIVLYPAVARAWGDRLAAAVAVALAHLTPLAFGVLTTANLTNAFGQSAATAALATLAIAAGPPISRVLIVLAGAFLLVAFLSHTSTFAITIVAATAMVLSFVILGRELRPLGRAFSIAVLVAGTIAAAGYYARFGDVYRSEFARIRGEVAAAPTSLADADQVYRPGLDGIADRIGAVRYYVVDYYGAPLLLLTAAGVWLIVRSRARDALSLALLGWSASCAAFFVLGMLTPVDMRYYLAACPVVAVLSARAAVAGWQGGGLRRIAAGALLTWSGWVGVAFWYSRLS